MSIILAALVELSTFNPIVIQTNTSTIFVDAMKSLKEASYAIIKLKKNRNQRKEFLLESGLIVMYEDFWSQCTLITIFEGPPQPISQKATFTQVKALVLQYKSVTNINKKFNEWKLGVQDIMSGLDGADRYSTKMTDIKAMNYSDYVQTLNVTRSRGADKPFVLMEAKQAIMKKYTKANNPFGNTEGLKKEIEELKTKHEDKNIRFIRPVD